MLLLTITGKHSTGQAILVVLQLFSGGVVVIYLDELLRKGYGFYRVSLYSLRPTFGKTINSNTVLLHYIHFYRVLGM